MPSSMEGIHEISSITFGILSDADIVAMSVCLVDKATLTEEAGSVYDPRMGCVLPDRLCVTCNKDIWSCPGHFGHVDLCVPVIVLYRQCLTFLRIICFECHRLCCSSEELTLNGISGFDRIYEFASKQSICFRCNTVRPDVRYVVCDNQLVATHRHKSEKVVMELSPQYILSVFDPTPDEDIRLLGLDPTMIHPRNFVLMRFPVIPTCCRPRVCTANMSSDDDLSLLIVDIVRQNNLIRKSAPGDDIDKAVGIIRAKTCAYVDNSKGKVTHNTNHKPMTGIKERITKKSGIVRQNLMGKRCDKTARTVVGPDPTLRLDQVVVPRDIARHLTVPEYVTAYNVDRLTRLVNADPCSIVSIERNGNKINVAHAALNRGTRIYHGDVIARVNGERYVVKNCATDLKADDKILDKQTGILEPVRLHSRVDVKLNIGDCIERCIEDGDPVLVNRQPTLHRNSMQGMRVVIKDGKTIRLNLAIVSGFNMDFDGDEGNIFSFETIESRAELLYLSNAKRNILSYQTNKSEMVIIQDSLLAAYQMTKTVDGPTIRFRDLCSILMHVVEPEYADVNARLVDIGRTRTSLYPLLARDVFAYILPSDFSMEWSNMSIVNGIIVRGWLDKTLLKSSHDSIVRLVCLEYGYDRAATLVDNIQFVTNAWLEQNPFSIGIEDCIIPNADRRREISQNVQKYFMEADEVVKSSNIEMIREGRINGALNRAKDIGLSIAKESMSDSNNFLDTVSSGSKGDYFNIAQITGLLGQQNIRGQRIPLTMNEGSRSMVHYPFVGHSYESRGFVSSSFINGMNPKEMFFHAMSGREGMISTAKGTATSGYIQRSCVKLNEDLRVAYDGTVRDANGNIYQLIYGNDGYDPSVVDFIHGGICRPIDIIRLASRASAHKHRLRRRRLSQMEMDDVVGRCKWKSTVPPVVYDNTWRRHERVLRAQLVDVELVDDRKTIDEFTNDIVRAYHVKRITPGECVGIISAQSIGERQTQSNLNTFHTAGKLREDDSVARFEELLTMTKNLKSKQTVVYFKTRYATAKDLRDDIGCSIVSVKFNDVCRRVKSVPSRRLYRLDSTISYFNRLSVDDVCRRLNAELGSAGTFRCEPVSSIRFEIFTDDDESMYCTRPVCGITGIDALYLDYADNEWYGILDGCNLCSLLRNPFVDGRRVYSNDVWETYECLGVAVLRRRLMEDLRNITNNVNDCHVRILMDKMTHKGKPTSITRYTMRTNEVGALSKATFEECTDVLLNACVRNERDSTSGVSSAIICGKQPKVGTAAIDVKLDLDCFSS